MTEQIHVERIQAARDMIKEAKRNLAFRIEAALEDKCRHSAIAFAAGITQARVSQIAKAAGIGRDGPGRPRKAGAEGEL